MKIDMIIVFLVIGLAIGAMVLIWRWMQKRKEPKADLTTELEKLTFPAPTPPTTETIVGNIEIFVRGKSLNIVDIGESGITIGRDPTSATVIISEPTVSKRHCSIVYEGGKVYVKDDRSTNGTYMENRKIMQQELHENDIVSLGRKGTVKIIYHGGKAR